MNGQGTIQLEGKDPVPVIFHEDITIQQKPQFGCMDWTYYISGVIMMVIFYVCIPLGIVVKGDLLAVCAIWIIYIISSCATNTTRYIFNV